MRHRLTHLYFLTRLLLNAFRQVEDESPAELQNKEGGDLREPSHGWYPSEEFRVFHKLPTRAVDTKESPKRTHPVSSKFKGIQTTTDQRQG